MLGDYGFSELWHPFIPIELDALSDEEFGEYFILLISQFNTSKLQRKNEGYIFGVGFSDV